MKEISDGLSRIIQTQFDNFIKPVTITDNYYFDMRATINKIDLYRSSRFLTGDSDSQNNRKYFFNILNAAAWAASKNIDMDIKDIKFVSKNGRDPLKARLYSQVFLKWAKDNHFAKFLNKMTEFLPSYGWFVAKFVDGKVYYVPAKDVYCYPGVDSIEKSPYVIEDHKMQPSTIRKMNWNQKDNIKEVIDAFNSSSTAQYIPVKLFYGVVANQELDQKYWNKKTTIDDYSDVYMAAALNLMTKQADSSQETISISKVLHIENTEGKKRPFKDVGYLDVDGRVMKLGIFELGFPFQERWNQIANEKNLAMKLGSKMIFQTRGKTVESNLMTDTDNGDILKIDSEITRVSTGVDNLGVYQQEEQNIQGVFRNLSNAQEIITGESMPSGTPFRLGAMLNQNTAKLFEYILEKEAIFIKEIVEDWLVPEFEKYIKTQKEVVLQLVDDDLITELIERDINARMNKAIKKYVLANGRFPSEEETQVVAQRLQGEYNTSKMYAKMTDTLLDFEKDVNVIISGEDVNLTQKVESLTNFTQLLAQNPGILQDPVTSKLFTQLLELTGVSPSDIKKPAMQPSLSEVAAPPGGNVGAQAQPIQQGV